MLLHRLGMAFDCLPPEIDESATRNESPNDLVARLADQKAQTISRQHPSAVVIGSDQLAVFQGQIITKPGSYSRALQQLQSFSGQVVEFLTAVSIQSIAGKFKELHTDQTQVCFRTLKSREIERYLESEKPFDCVGAFKAESLGIALFDRIISEDPTALIGLPLIRTAAILRRAGLELP